MRISDWSSDVCSSDLDTLRRPRQSRARRCQRRSRRGAWCRGSSGGPPVGQIDADAVANGHRLAVERVDFGVRERDGGIESGAEVDPAGGIARAVEFGALLGERNERSEEHTSELQSLMRNSYAVFCLKKKQNENNIEYSR